ncbi:oxidoreductase family protein [Sodiomyces alkalinus F11]|uniref:Oxidoreductase family protein n=1 Tax=Sodiomyces alkalinus (strain CBS 110278 / VKM F-3762 / F11) TaxID=1314773 RepID=A0A3N2PPU8_SODAK|nr:oxidoreductase family protein [Sodiomyces alkalinus F11]ROT36470.1 oxidoreductase family protein [Sodiomyces alkalinus F11]
MTTSPIRIALIGLSANSGSAWAAGAHLPYLISPRGKKHYTIVALLNSSPAAALAARDFFHLPASVKTYGDPEALAADPDIDLVVCITRVDIHFPTIAPSLRAGKPVYVEWPLTDNLPRALELERLSDKTAWESSILGLQGRVDPVVLKLASLLREGRIGKVLSSDVRAWDAMLPRDQVPQVVEYLSQRKVGGNRVTIAYAHFIDSVHSVLGEFDGFQARVQLRRPEIDVVDGFPTGNVVRKTATDVPDLVAVHGALKGKDYVADRATLTAAIRSGPPFKGDPAFVWSIHGEKGEMQFTIPTGPYLQVGHEKGQVSVKVHDFATDTVEDVEWDWQDWQKELPLRARDVGELYERYAAWVEGGKGKMEEGREFTTVASGMARMRETNEVLAQFDQQQS